MNSEASCAGMIALFVLCFVGAFIGNMVAALLGV
jgi:hypothetical protein